MIFLEGIFLKKKFNGWFFVLFLCGLSFIGLCIFLNIVDSEATSGVLTFLIVGILLCLSAILSWLLNFGAFIHINEDSIKAKYHWFGKIDCKLSDITFVIARTNTLIIQLKDGKTHTIMGVENSNPLALVIRRNMCFDLNDQPKTLIEKLNGLKAVKKKEFICVCLCVVFMFINIFITVALTGERELYEFSKTDWTIFAVMGVVEIVTMIFAFCFAGKIAKNNLSIEKLQYAIQRRIIETYALLSGNIIKVFADENYTSRLTLFGYPNDESVYYAVQKFDSDYTLIKTYESEIFENVEQLQYGLEALIDITERALN